MNKKIIFSGLIVAILLVVTTIFLNTNKNHEEKNKPNELTVMVIGEDDSSLTVISNDDIIYTIEKSKLNGTLGDNILITYTGIIDKFSGILDVDIVDYNVLPRANQNDTLVSDNFNGVFGAYYKMAQNKLSSLNLDEKIGQLLLTRYDESTALNDIDKYKLSGFVFFEKDFKNKTADAVKKMISNLQNRSDIPLLTAVDEEGGKVVRISSNPNLVSEKFASSKELYSAGGMNAIKEDTINKSKVLKNLGLNLNLAPVVDVSTDSNDYMYERSLGENTETTSLYAKTVIEASKDTGVSYTLKHFPGYGNNPDTHNTAVTDTRSYEDIMAIDIPPFTAGINAGAEAVLVSHNIVSSIDPDNPASLSIPIHNLLRDDLNFTGVIITDDLAMGAVNNIQDATTKAVLAGNNLIITTDYQESFNSIKNAINNGTISEDLIDRLALRVLAFKYYKGLMLEEK